MSRRARPIIPNLPYHVTHRGNHRAPILATDDERQMYASIMHRWMERTRVLVAAFTLMPNHVHFVASSPTPLALGAWIRHGHGEHSKWYNTIRSRTGQNWEGRFYSVLMDPDHCLNALRYVEQNPVRAGLSMAPWEWKWSSAAFHAGLGPQPSILTADFRPADTTALAWRKALREPTADDFRVKLAEAARRGSPLASDSWLEQLEERLGTKLRVDLKPRGRPRTVAPRLGAAAAGRGSPLLFSGSGTGVASATSAP